MSENDRPTVHTESMARLKRELLSCLCAWLLLAACGEKPEPARELGSAQESAATESPAPST